MSGMTEYGPARGYPLKISVRVQFSDESVREYEIDNLAALSLAPNETRAQQGLPRAELPPKWTPDQARLAAVYGTCEKCGEPRDTRYVSEFGVEIFCPACG